MHVFTGCKIPFFIMYNSKRKPSIPLGLIIKPARQDDGPDHKIPMIVKLLISILQLLLK
jgi:hypothetical protein